MRDKGQILAEVFDSLIRHDSGKIPSEVGELFNLGLRLHNECPDIDPAFMERLRRRAASEPIPRRSTPAAGLLGGLSAFLGRLWHRPALQRLGMAALALAGAMVLSLVFIPAARDAVLAGLGRSIPAFEGAVVEEQAQPDATPHETKLIYRWTDLDEARLEAGFPLREPSYRPDGLVFQWASKDRIDGRDRVTLHYSSPTDFGARGNSSLGLIIQEFPIYRTPTEAKLHFAVGLDSVETMTIAGRPAVLIQGQWNPGGRWLPYSPVRVLILQDGDVVVHITGAFERSEMIQIARSLFS